MMADTLRSSASTSGDALEQSRALEARGRLLEALDVLKGARRDGGTDARIMRLRHEAFEQLDRTRGRDVWPPPYADPFPGKRSIPEVHAHELSTAVLGAAILCHGCLLVRGLVAPDEVARLRADVDRAFERGDLDEVRSNIRRYGAIDCCELRKGWFEDTLPQHHEPIVLCFLDVDYEASMHDCVVHLWPHVTDQGYVFIDEYTRLDYCALFFSESFWSRHFDAAPPGLMGVGTGVGVGQCFLGAFKGRPPIQAPSSVAYTRKDFYGQWDFACADTGASNRSGGS